MYLKPTQSLWSSVETKIEEMFKERLVYALNWTNYGLTKTEFDQLCIASIIPAEEEKLVQQLGEKWFPTVDELMIRIHNGTSYDSYTVSTKAGGRKPLVSPNWNQYGDTNKPRVNDERIKDIARRRHEAWEKINSEKKEFIASVKKVWDDVPSINAMLKIWPPIVDLLPVDAVRRLEEKTTRRSIKDLAADVDTKSLSVHILKAKVAR